MSHLQEANAELKQGRFPNRHSITFVFPQLSGLGEQNKWSAARALSSVDEAKIFLEDKKLKGRLIESLNRLREGARRGFTPAQQQPQEELVREKIQACLTLFEAAARGTSDQSLFTKPLFTYFGGARHDKTVRRLDDLQRGIHSTDDRAAHPASSTTSRRAPETRLAQPSHSAASVSPRTFEPWDANDLHKYVEAQNANVDLALQEIRRGRVGPDVAWHFFPQPAEFEGSAQSAKFGIKSKAQANAFMQHQLLAKRLERCLDALMEAINAGHKPSDILGDRHDHVRASLMTLFLAHDSPVDSPIEQKFREVLTALGRPHDGALKFMR